MRLCFFFFLIGLSPFGSWQFQTMIWESVLQPFFDILHFVSSLSSLEPLISFVTLSLFWIGMGLIIYFPLSVCFSCLFLLSYCWWFKGMSAVNFNCLYIELLNIASYSILTSAFICTEWAIHLYGLSLMQLKVNTDFAFSILNINVEHYWRWMPLFVSMLICCWTP